MANVDCETKRQKRCAAARPAATACESGDAPVIDEGAVSPTEGRAAPTAGGDRVVKVAVAVIVVLGLFLRIWILGRAPITADQAVVGLMAREILHGHFFVTFWGQNYGGGEPYVVAALFALLGQSRLALGLAPVVLSAIAALLVWRVGRRLFDQRTAVLAALIFWVWPEVYVYLSTVEWGFSSLTLVCGLAVLLYALRLAGPRSSRLTDWAALGLFLGLGWWCSPEIAYYAVPALLWLICCAVRRRAHLRPAAFFVLVGATTLGALPWLVVNVGDAYQSLRPGPQPHGMPWMERLSTFFVHVAPLVLGVRLRGTGAWLGGPVFGLTLYGLLAVLIVTWVVVLALERRAVPLVVFVALFPLAYATSPFSWNWKDGRYAVYLAPVLALLVASALSAIARRPSRLARAAPVLGLVAALALTAAAAARLAPYVPLAGSSGSRSSWTSWRADPNEWLRPLLTTLERSHVRTVYAGYSLAYPLTFEAHGRVVASYAGDAHYPPYLAVVARSRRQAWVFPTPSALGALDALDSVQLWLPSVTLADLESYLKQHAVPYRIQSAGYFTIVYPARAVVVGQ